jgi:hypothetical protein
MDHVLDWKYAHHESQAGDDIDRRQRSGDQGLAIIPLRECTAKYCEVQVWS